MTKKERIAVNKLRAIDAPYCVRYKSLNGRDYFKVLSSDHRPIVLVTPGTFTLWDNRGLVTIDKESTVGRRFIFDKEKAVGLLNDWEAKKKAAEEKKAAKRNKAA